MKYKLAIFDLDGTILDTLEDLADSVNYALGECGYPLRTIEEVRHFVGNGIRNLIERAVPAGLTEEEINGVHQVFSAYYQEHCADKTRPYEGIVPLLERLRSAGCLTAVVSNKADVAVQPLCQRYYDGLFDYAVGEREGIRRKPAPDAVQEVLRRLEIEAHEAIYIGDSEVDIRTAENAGLDSIIVTWGFRDRAYLESQGGRQFADQPEEVDAIIL
ncbi:MAG: HAD-IA family hydrolase [Acetatifactor sp.]|nr:HAD-IA family hydrolase [Acetatifactor sp.]